MAFRLKLVNSRVTPDSDEQISKTLVRDKNCSSEQAESNACRSAPDTLISFRVRDVRERELILTTGSLVSIKSVSSETKPSSSNISPIFYNTLRLISILKVRKTATRENAVAM